MDTSPNSTSNADIKRKLDEMIDYQLFEAPSWPIADDEVRPFFRMLEEMGLKETVPGTKDTFRYTALGIDCGAPLASYFIGATEPTEIPEQLEMQGLIEAEEAEAFYSSLEDEDENVFKQVEMLVRRAHRRFCGVKKDVMQ